MAATPVPAHLLATDRRARDAEPEIVAWFLLLVDALRSVATVGLVAEAAGSGNPVSLLSALAAVPVPQPQFEEQMVGEAQAALRLVETRQAGGQRIQLRFDVRDPGFQRAVQEQGGRLIREVPDSVRDVVNRIVADAYRDGLHPYRFAPQIRAAVGLTERQAVAVMRYAVAQTERGASSKFVQKAAGRYADRLLRQRAVLIARTETLRAANQSLLAGWRQAGDHGLIERATATVAWSTALDERVCETYCAPLEGVEAPLDAPIFDGSAPPPAHPDCRCVLQLL